MMIKWRDLRATCKECGDRASFSVTYSNEDLPRRYLRDGTREIGYCMKHLPEEVKTSRKMLIAEAQRPFGVII